MKKIFIWLLTLILMFSLCSCSNNSVEKNNLNLRKAILTNNSPVIKLNDLTSFNWDKVYIFDETVTKQQIEKVIGCSSKYIKQSENSNFLNIVFVKDNKVVSSITKNTTELGFNIKIPINNANYGVIEYSAKRNFNYSKYNGFVTLTLI